VKIPVTVKMRAGWNESTRNAPELARRVQDAGAAAVTIHGRTAEQSYSGTADWDLVARVARELTIPVLGSGDCIEPEQIVEKLTTGSLDTQGVVSGVLVGRGVLRNPWILAQAVDLAAGRAPRAVTLEERGRFLLDYIELLLNERVHEPAGFRHLAPGHDGSLAVAPARGHDRWVINKIRALCSWYSKGLEGGSHLRIRVNAAETVSHLQEIIEEFFAGAAAAFP
jgi:tRNA-dihydrouridine synthase